MTDIDKCKALEKLGYSQEIKKGDWYYDGKKIILNYYPVLDVTGKNRFAIPTEIGLMEWIIKEKGVGEIITTSSTAYDDGKLRHFVKTGATTEPILSDAFLELIDALLDLLKKMGVLK